MSGGRHPNATPAAYVAAIKRVFLSHACVVSAFTAADEKLRVTGNAAAFPWKASSVRSSWGRVSTRRILTMA